MNPLTTWREIKVKYGPEPDYRLSEPLERDQDEIKTRSGPRRWLPPPSFPWQAMGARTKEKGVEGNMAGEGLVQVL